MYEKTHRYKIVSKYFRRTPTACFTIPVWREDFSREMSRVAAPSSRLEDLPKYRCIALTSILSILLP